MTDEAKKTVKNYAADSPGSGSRKRWVRIFLIASASVLVVALAVTVILFMGNTDVSQDRIERVVEHNTVLRGVSIAGIDISGMTEKEAREATAHIEGDLLDVAVFMLDIDGETVTYNADDFEMTTDYEEMITKAVAYGHSGTFDERRQAAGTAKQQGIDFPVETYIDKNKVDEVVATLKALKDKEPTEAQFTFMPWGYMPDGTEYTPDMLKMYDTIADKDEYVFPEGLVRVDEMPLEIRYQYYEDDYFYREHHDDKVYIPNAANISRFLYAGEVYGVVIDKNQTVDLIMAAVENDDYTTIQVPVEITHTETNIEEIKKNTQLITSWTSSFRDHKSWGRVYNVAKLSSIICGVIIEPGEEWSINEEAGPRYHKYGWKDAIGITGGRSEMQPGGGVCQISSTIYNAALRAGLEIVDSSRHSIVSDYIPIGLDATISTGSPDLVLKNPYDTPIYIVSYANGDHKNVTVEIYGAPLKYEKDGQQVDVIYDFSSRQTGSGSAPAYKTVSATQLPDGTPLAVGQSEKWKNSRGSKSAKVWKHYLDLDGNELQDKEFLYQAYYPSQVGVIYVNDLTPVPTPTPDPTDPGDPGDPPAPTP